MDFSPQGNQNLERLVSPELKLSTFFRLCVSLKLCILFYFIIILQILSCFLIFFPLIHVNLETGF